MNRRILVVALLLVVTFGYLARKSTAEPTLVREPLSLLPMQLGPWSGRQSPDLDERILNLLGVDDYSRRTYAARTEPGWVGLYIGYYASQRQGDTVHSPLNCLPGAGWTPISQDRATLTVKDTPTAPANREITINRFVIQKGLDRQLVLYWYQSHGRVVASEYWGRVYTVTDAIRHNRTDAALVRVIVPILGDTPDAVSAAETRGVRFVQALFPYLGRHLPS
jgi:EpsI family protein